MHTKPYWISGPWPGKLAIIPRPRGGDWLADEVRSWRQAEIDVIASLLMPAEVAELGLTKEEQHCHESGIEYLSFPIVDRSVPQSQQETVEFVDQLEKLITAGKVIAIHCRQGIGRSSIVAACLMISSGVEPDEALGEISSARGVPIPDTPEQREWILKFANRLFALKS